MNTGKYAAQLNILFKITIMKEFADMIYNTLRHKKYLHYYNIPLVKY